MIEKRYQMVHKKARKPEMTRLIKSAAIIAHIFMVPVLVAGCLSYYNKVDQYTYAKTQDYVSFKVSGMSYSRLEQEGGSSGKLGKVRHRLGVLVNNYQKADTSEDFYRWTLSNYDFLFYDE
jgi:hypothetical protein